MRLYRIPGTNFSTTYVPYRMKIWQKKCFAKMLKNHFDKKLNKILIILVELLGDLVKFTKLLSPQTFVLYGSQA